MSTPLKQVHEESWAAVSGYVGAYEVSDRGRVRSLDRKILYSDGRQQNARGVLLKLTVTPSGYHVVGLWRGGQLVIARVHRLVAEAFLPAPQRHEWLVRHLDGNPLNNAPSNLAWGTQLENSQDALRHGTAALQKRAMCVRGHKLVAPNLRRTRRACRACHQAYQHVRKAAFAGVHLNYKNESDCAYARIMGGAA